MGLRTLCLVLMLRSNTSFYVGNLGPVPFFVDASAVLLLAYVLFFWPISISERLIVLAVIVLSIVLHELGHAFMARRFGAHGVSIYLTGMGGLCTHSPTSQPKQSMLISVAGPLTNVVLALVGWLALTYFPLAYTDTDAGFMLYAFCYYLFHINLFLAILNSLPIYPLDGGQTLFAALHLTRYSVYRCRRITLITSFVAAGVGVGLYVLITGEEIGMFLTILLLYLLYQAYEDLS